jgi:hypothetical protein
MAIALVTHAIAGNSDGAVNASVTTPGVDTTGATFLVVHAAYAHTKTPTITDSNGNAWTALNEVVGDGPSLRTYYCANPVVSAGHTFTLTVGSATLLSIAMLAFSGLTNGAVDQQSFDTSAGGGAGGGSGANTNADVGSITPSANGALIVVGHTNDTFASNPVASNDGGILTRIDNIVLADPFGTPDYYSLATWWGVQPTVAAINIHLNWGATASYAQQVGAFLPATPSGAARLVGASPIRLNLVGGTLI